MTDRKDYTPEEEELIIQQLNSPEGRELLREHFKLAAKAADHFPPGSLGYYLGRAIAGLPLKIIK